MKNKADKKEYSKEDFYNKLVSPLRPMIEPVMIGDPDEVWGYCKAYAKQEVKAKDEEIEKLLGELKRYRTDKYEEIDKRLGISACVDCRKIYKTSEMIQAYNSKSNKPTSYICKECYEARIPL